MALMEELEHLKISLDVIKLATNNFSAENFIGHGGFGKVYKGDLSSKMVAVKRLDRALGQGDHEFLMEIMMLSRYRHKNLVSLLGFCDENNEKVLVYEHEFNGSLDRYLSSSKLTWIQRLKICIGAASGLEYLHNPLGTQQRVLHRDVKSSNVLLDQNWEAKISDFGLSKIGPANQEYTFLVSNAVGTLGYVDPQYVETGILTKESDVYSFGVVLFEVLCGRLCVGKESDQHRLLAQLAQYSYEHEKLDDIVWHGIREQMEPNSLNTYSSIAYRCLQRDRKQRPTMAEVLKELEIAFEYQESHESTKPMEYEEIIKMADGEHPLVYTNKRELKLLLSKGILVDWDRRWFSLSKSGNNCEMISASEFSFQHPESIDWISNPKSRFPEVAIISGSSFSNIQVDVEAKLLSPGITYAVYLVFKYYSRFTEEEEEEEEEEEITNESIFVGIQYRHKELKVSYIAYVGEERDDGWIATELCQFVSHKKVARFEVLLENSSKSDDMLLEGIEFLPVDEKINDESIEVDVEEKNGEQKLPNDYRRIVSRAKDHVPYNMTKNEIFLLLSNGILIDKGNMFFSLNKKGKKCYMLPARAFLQYDEDQEYESSHLSCFDWISMRESRFLDVAECKSGDHFGINCEISSRMLSPNTTYATYLIYKLPTDVDHEFGFPLQVTSFSSFSGHGNESKIIFLTKQKTPIIKITNDDQDENQDRTPKENPMYKPKMEGLPKERKDGWIEVRVWGFVTGTDASKVDMDVRLTSFSEEQLTGLIIHGIEFRP